jgi:hypothetical protein
MAQTHSLYLIVIADFCALACGCLVLLTALVRGRIYPPDEPRLNRIGIPAFCLGYSAMVLAMMTINYPWGLYLNSPALTAVLVSAFLCMVGLLWWARYGDRRSRRSIGPHA